MRTATRLGLLLLTLPALGCGPRSAQGVSVQPWSGPVTIKSEQVKLGVPAPSPQTSDSEVQQVADGCNRFALDLYRQLQGREGNLFFSPYSISIALAMTYAGARGETEKHLDEALHFSLPQPRLHPAYNALGSELARRAGETGGPYRQGLELHLANSLWIDQRVPLLPAFLEVLGRNYHASVWKADVTGDREGVRADINNWVANETQGRIRELVPPDGAAFPGGIMLVNAIYFNAPWQFKFRRENTRRGDFHLLNRKTILVDMMSQHMHFRYAEVPGCQAAELPYDGAETAMLILLPAEGRFREFENSLGPEAVEAIVERLSDHAVNVSLPRFDCTSGFSLKEALSAVGMADAFRPGADFSGMAGPGDYYLTDVLHKATVHTDEDGTVAAAGTYVGVGARVSRPVEFTADRPFIYLIRDLRTGAILFIGRVLDPRG